MNEHGEKYDEKTDRHYMDRSCFGWSGNSDDNFWNLQRRDVCGFHKSSKYLYGVYWNWIIRR